MRGSPVVGEIVLACILLTSVPSLDMLF